MTAILALIGIIVGIVLAARNGEYRNGTFWLVCAVVLLVVWPLASGLISHA